MNTTSKNVLYLTLSLLTLLAGYAYLRYAYRVTDHFPFTQEIVLILLGTVATVFITSLLLNKQTAVEIEKEQNVRHLELKSSIYQQLLDLLEEMSLVDQFGRSEFTRLQFITHKLAIVAAPEVLDEYHSFLEVVRAISTDKSFIGDAAQLHQALGSLTIKIRADLIGDGLPSEYTQSQVDAMIQQNSSESAAMQ